MLAKTYSCALVGLDGAIVQVEVDLNPKSLPAVALVGLPDAAVEESTERVRAAAFNSGLVYPRGRITVNRAPADLRKDRPTTFRSRSRSSCWRSRCRPTSRLTVT